MNKYIFTDTELQFFNIKVGRGAKLQLFAFKTVQHNARWFCQDLFYGILMAKDEMWRS